MSANQYGIKKIKIQNKGYGYVASRDIDRYSIVCIDQSIIPIVKNDNDTTIEIMVLYFLKMLNDTQMDIYEKLMPTVRDEYFAKIDIKKQISRCKNHKVKTCLSREKYEMLLEKYKRNAFNLDNTGNTISPGILLDGAIFNHSCNPNVSFSYNKGKMYFFANTDIKKGDELCISYIDISMEYSERQKHLRERYGFLCDCQMCTDRDTCQPDRICELKSLKTIDVRQLH